MNFFAGHSKKHFLRGLLCLLTIMIGVNTGEASRTGFVDHSAAYRPSSFLSSGITRQTDYFMTLSERSLALRSRRLGLSVTRQLQPHCIYDYDVQGRPTTRLSSSTVYERQCNYGGAFSETRKNEDKTLITRDFSLFSTANSRPDVHACIDYDDTRQLSAQKDNYSHNATFTATDGGIDRRATTVTGTSIIVTDSSIIVGDCIEASTFDDLFQGLWTDPTTGIAYARNRWYDARNASWLSEDPKGAVDSVNLYAFVGWEPHMHVDPMGTGKKKFWRNLRKLGETPKRLERARKLKASAEVWNRVKRSDVIGISADGLASVGGVAVHVPPGAKLGKVFKYTNPRTGRTFDVPISGEGWSEFSAYSIRKIENFNMTGDSKLDIARANKVFSKSGYSWHHHHDAKTMMLVPSDLNAMRHTGGDAVVDAVLKKAKELDPSFPQNVWDDVKLAGTIALSILASEEAAASDGDPDEEIDAVDVGIEIIKMTTPVGIQEDVKDVGQGIGQSVWDRVSALEERFGSKGSNRGEGDEFRRIMGDENDESED